MDENIGPNEVLMMLSTGLIDWWESSDGYVIWYDANGQYRCGRGDMDNWANHEIVDPTSPDFADQLRQIKEKDIEEVKGCSS